MSSPFPTAPAASSSSSIAPPPQSATDELVSTPGATRTAPLRLRPVAEHVEPVPFTDWIAAEQDLATTFAANQGMIAQLAASRSARDLAGRVLQLERELAMYRSMRDTARQFGIVIATAEEHAATAAGKAALEKHDDEMRRALAERAVRQREVQAGASNRAA